MNLTSTNTKYSAACNELETLIFETDALLTEVVQNRRDGPETLTNLLEDRYESVLNRLNLGKVTFDDQVTIRLRDEQVGEFKGIERERTTTKLKDEEKLTNLTQEYLKALKFVADVKEKRGQR